MLRRKNPDQNYLQVQTNHSPYRFQRKNPNLSPGLSPMRCRTPTRGNISPFRTTNNNENYRAHSPIKFVTSKIANPINQMGKGFFRTQTHTNYQAQYNQKYATFNTNNDHSMKRQSFFDNPSSSKMNAPYQNSQRAMLHENTKLFSKLVEKINSQKKKQPQLVRRNTKPQIYRPEQINQVQQKPSCVEKLTKQKSQTDQLKVEPINQHIKPVESVVYQERQVRNYTYQHQTSNYMVSGKENNKDYEHKNSYRLKQKTEKNHTGALQIAKNDNFKVKDQDKSHSQTKVHQKSTTPSKKQDGIKKEISVKKQEQKQQPTNKLTNQNNHIKTKVNQGPKKNHKYEDPHNFDDLDLLLGKITNVPKPEPQEIRKSISKISSASNVYNSINMDPYL